MAACGNEDGGGKEAYVEDTVDMGFGDSKGEEHVVHTEDKVFEGSHTVVVEAVAGRQEKACIVEEGTEPCWVGNLVAEASALEVFVFGVVVLLVVEGVWRQQGGILPDNLVLGRDQKGGCRGLVE